VVPTNSYYLRTLPPDRWAAEHPIRRMPAAGLRIHPNTDDPPLHRIDPAGCWRMMMQDFGFGLDDLRGFMLNGIDAAFIAEADKPGLRATFTAEFDRLRATLDHSA
jgi:adenosine deaminase